VDEGRKRVLLIAASILAARKLAQYDSGARVPATVAAIADGVRWAERIMEEIDRRHPSKPASLGTPNLRPRTIAVSLRRIEGSRLKEGSND
jgi:hypothetical protein